MVRTKGRILVIRGGAIGDFILTLPVLSALRENFPDTHVEVLGYPHIASLAAEFGVVDGVRSIESGALAGFFADRGQLNADLEEYFASFSIIVSYLFDPDQIFETNVKRCTQGQFLVGRHRPVDTDGIHATAVFLKPLERLAIFDSDPSPRLFRQDPSRGSAQRLAMHPGSGGERKVWAEEGWVSLIERFLTETDQSLLIVGGEAEGDRIRRLEKRFAGDRMQVALNCPLPELARRLAQCDGFVGHDSGITHLAAALGLKGAVLWGPSVEEVWRPQTDRMQVVRSAQGLAGISVEEVFRVLENQGLAGKKA